MASREDRTAAYRKQIEQINDEIIRSQAGDGKFSFYRVISFMAAGFTLAYALLDGSISAWWALLPGALFVAVVVIHETKLRIVEQNKRRVDFFNEGIARIEGEWQGHGIHGTEFKDEDHLYSNDLNLFGEASLFQKLCMCTTAFGRERLASWLIKPAEADVITQRQKAVRELAEDEKLKAEYAALNKEESEHLAIDVFKSWSKGEITLYNPLMQYFSLLIGLATVGSLIGWVFLNMSPFPFIACLIVDLIMIRSYSEKVSLVTEGISNKEKNLLMLSRVLNIMEKHEYKSELLKTLIEKLKSDGISAGQRIEQIALLINSFENARSNMAMQPLNIFLHINLRNAMRIERWRHQAGAKIPEWVDAAADFEALFSIAVMTYENPDYIFPEFREKCPCFNAVGLGHPLLHPQQCVRNDIELGESKSLVLISGSNMAGKSTFLRTVGVNIVLAQTGAPVCAKELAMSRFNVGCSIQIEDNMAKGISHFKAEILRLKKLVSLARESELPVMFFFDEILHGTNSSDRCNGATAVIKTLVNEGTVGFVTTHDLSLAKMVDELDGKAVNAHFEDQFKDGEMTFDYKMKNGVVTRGNALELMRSEGLDV